MEAAKKKQSGKNAFVDKDTSDGKTDGDAPLNDIGNFSTSEWLKEVRGSGKRHLRS